VYRNFTPEIEAMAAVCMPQSRHDLGQQAMTVV
jgi:hypothetical protein